MKRLAIGIFILVLVVSGVWAQDMEPVDNDGDGLADCLRDFTDAKDLLDQAATAETVEELQALASQARESIIIQQIYCLGLSVDETVGATRATPSPVGIPDTVIIESFTGNGFQGTAFVSEIRRLTNEEILEANQFNDVAPEGQQYVVVTLSLTCAETVITTCEARWFDWNLVGSAGRVYEAELVTGIYGDDFELFGGGSGELLISYLVQAGEDQFVVFSDGDEPTFLAAE